MYSQDTAHGQQDDSQHRRLGAITVDSIDGARPVVILQHVGGLRRGGEIVVELGDRAGRPVRVVLVGQEVEQEHQLQSIVLAEEGFEHRRRSEDLTKQNRSPSYSSTTARNSLARRMLSGVFSVLIRSVSRETVVQAQADRIVEPGSGSS